MSDPIVLFVDDEEDLRDVARQTLDLADLPVATFAEAEGALPELEGQAAVLVEQSIEFYEDMKSRAI